MKGQFLSIPNAPVGVPSDVDLTSESTIIYSFSVQYKVAHIWLEFSDKPQM
jgi:hypothetical protein